jgi:hypothetical protein
MLHLYYFRKEMCCGVARAIRKKEVAENEAMGGIRCGPDKIVW